MEESNGRTNSAYTEDEPDGSDSQSIIKKDIACRYDGEYLQSPKSNAKIFSNIYSNIIETPHITPSLPRKAHVAGLNLSGDNNSSTCKNCSLISMSRVGDGKDEKQSTSSDHHCVIFTTSSNNSKNRDASLQPHIRSLKLKDNVTAAMAPFKYLPDETPNSDLGVFSIGSVIANYGHHDTSKTELPPIHLDFSTPVGTKKCRWNSERRDQCVMKSKQFINVSSKFLIIYPLICVSVWAMLYIFWGDMALPGGSLFALVVLEISAIFLGRIAELLCLPPLLGMLCAGFILRNVSYVNVAKDLHISISSPFRGISIVILLARGAFSVNPSNIKKFKNVVPSLAVVSCIVEAIFGGLAAYFVIGFPPAWAALMGCIMSAMSGAAVMPYLLNIEKNVTHEGADVTGKAVEALLIAKTACGLDAILAICMAEFALGFIFGEGILSTSLLKGPVEVVMGGAFGLLWGGISGFLLNGNGHGDLRMIAIFSCGVMSLIGLSKIGYPRGGPLGVFLGTLIAVSVWRHEKPLGINNVTKGFDKLWFLFQPLLFGILGARTSFDTVNWTIVGQGAICLGISMTARLLASFLMTNWSKLSFRERLFLVTAWMPKGTVQAALGPVAFDTAIDLGLGKDYQDLAYQVMNVAATTIVLASITGSLVLQFIGPRFLHRS